MTDLLSSAAHGTRRAPRPRVRYLACGGTIASAGMAAGGPVSPRLSAAEIMERVPAAHLLADIEPRDLLMKPGGAIQPNDWLMIARQVELALREGCSGVVITQGTDTLEETAYALAVLLPREAPVALTGSMRSATHVGSEGGANLLSAFQVATSAIRKLGPVVVMNDEIHAPRFVTKLETNKPSAFSSPGAGPLGEVTEGRVDLWWSPRWTDMLGMPASMTGIDVEILKILTGASRLVETVSTIRVSGIVLEAFGGGHVPPEVIPSIRMLAETGTPLLLASRTISGSILEGTYAMPGGELELIASGAVPVGRLNSQKARLRLMIGLALGRDVREIFPVR